MKIFIHIVLFTFTAGFLAGWIGLFIGIISAAFVKGRGNRFKGSILGLLAGVMIGIVCFDLIPDTFMEAPLHVAIFGIALGLFLAVFLDGTIENYNTKLFENRNNYFKAAIFMSIGIGIHNLPSGIAVGSLSILAPENGLNLIIAMILHGIPEGLTIGILLSECHANKLKQVLISVITSIPMGLGAIFGGFLDSSAITCISLGFASSMILYVTLRETLPAASETWKGRTTTIGNVIGIIVGMLMVSFLH